MTSAVSRRATAAHRHRVLLVDDSAVTREAFEAALAVRGMMVVPVRDGDAALQILWNEAPPCLIILDLRMPHMDGWKFRAEQVADAGIATIPVVMITGHGNHVDEDRAVRLGVRAFMRKPVDADEVAEVVERTCRVSAARVADLVTRSGRAARRAP